MKVLYLSGGVEADYQCDMLFHGLREILGSDLVDSQRIWFMYQADVPPIVKQSLYGRGFTIAGRLPDLEVDRDDLEAKIRSRYFNFVVYGSAWRSLDHLALVQQCYPASQIAFIDGEDSQQFRPELLSVGHYFKRECTRASTKCLPINFAIPQDAVLSSVPAKTRVVATVVPGQPETYVFSTEEEYYADYASSIMAITTRKAGWDCLRHYEILANGCIPYFCEIEQCPSHTMISLPKRFLLRARRHPENLSALPPEVFEACRKFASECLTTRVLATDFLDALSSGRRRIPCTQLTM